MDFFVQTVTHDLKNPIGSILSATELLESAGAGSDPAEKKELLGMIRKCGENALNFIQDLLNLLRNSTWLQDLGRGSRRSPAGGRRGCPRVRGNPDPSRAGEHHLPRPGAIRSARASGPRRRPQDFIPGAGSTLRKQWWRAARRGTGPAGKCPPERSLSGSTGRPDWVHWRSPSGRRR